jgi:hypothetical protein
MVSCDFAEETGLEKDSNQKKISGDLFPWREYLPEN